MITIVNANTKKLKSLSLKIPTNKLIVVTGNKGSGKSALVCDVIFNEAQQRYYASLCIQNKLVSKRISKSKVQFISGLPPAILLKNNCLTENLKRSIESGLRGVLYIFKNPTKGLNTTEINTLIYNLYLLKNLGNTLIIIEQNIQFIKNAEYIIELESTDTANHIVFQGKLVDAMQSSKSKIAEKILIDKSIPIKIESNVFELYNPISLNGVKTNKLKNITVEIPVNRITCIAGVAGSGKSSLAFDTLNFCAIKAFQSISKLVNIQEKDSVFVSINGLMPTVAINGFKIKPKKYGTVGSITGLSAHLNKLFEKVNNPESTVYKVFGLTIHEICLMPVSKLLMEFRKQVVVPQSFSSNATEQRVLQIMAGSIINGLDILDKLGLGYLNLSRQALTLSNGEGQRVRLSAGMAQDISGVCFILNEPTSGLHPSDLENLFFMLYELKRQGNTVLVCENNAGFIRYSDHVIELGPKSGNEGGMLIYEGDVKTLLTSEKSMVSKYLAPEYEFKRTLLLPDFENSISIKKARANNLKQINLDIPTHSLVVISGVSGSGKSSLMNEVIYETYLSGTATNCSEIKGFEHFNQLVLVDQNIPKGNSKISVAEYLGLFDTITNRSSINDLPLSELTKSNNNLHENTGGFISMFLIDYLRAGQKLKSLNHGEMQRVNIVKKLLENQNSPTLFLIDEPTAGLHMQDVEKLITAFDYLLEKGHSLIAIEHHKTVIENADYLIELGPGAGDEGGQVV